MPYPKVFLNIKNRSAPCVVRNAQEEAVLDPAEWSRDPLANPPDAGTYPKLMYNVNIPPVIVLHSDHEARLGSSWRQSPVVVPNDPPVKLDPEGDSVSRFAGTGSFNVTITGYGKNNFWTATKDDYADWLSFTPMNAQSADGTVNYSYTQNLGIGGPRTAHIYVNGQIFTIDQNG